MFRLFSSIRQNLLAENKTVRYLKYAVGEFLLIVAGILIALQINNWKEGRNVEKQRVELIENLKADFRTNLVRLEEEIANIETVSGGILNFMKGAAGKNSDLSVEGLKSLAVNVFEGPIRFQPALGAYQTALGTAAI